MKRYRWWLAFFVFVSAVSFVRAEEPAEALPQPGLKPPGNEKVIGTVEKITDGMVFLKTANETIRTFSVKQEQRERIKGLRAGDRIRLEVNEGDQVINVEKVSGGGVPGGKKGYRLITGEIVKFDPTKKSVTLRLKDGKRHAYRMKDAATTKMIDVKDDLKEGASVTLEIDRKNSLIEDFSVKGYPLDPG
jgi:hypothetical protein